MLVVMALAGCAGRREALQPVAWSPDGMRADRSRIGVVMRSLPERETSFPGARCLMCRPLAAASNAALTAHVATLGGTEELAELRSEVVALLRKRGLDVVDITEPLTGEGAPPQARDEAAVALAELTPDIVALRDRHALSRLMVLEFDTLGVHRPYIHYAPASAPYAVVEGRAYVLDLATRKLHWNHRMHATLMAEGEWEEAPDFPGLSNAYFQVIEKVKDRVKQILGRNP
jgi:hypothetical protein